MLRNLDNKAGKQPPSLDVPVGVLGRSPVPAELI